MIGLFPTGNTFNPIDAEIDQPPLINWANVAIIARTSGQINAALYYSLTFRMVDGHTYRWNFASADERDAEFKQIHRRLTWRRKLKYQRD